MLKSFLFVLVIVATIGLYETRVAPLLAEDSEDKIINEFVVIFHQRITEDLAIIHLKNLSSHPDWDMSRDIVKHEFRFDSFSGYSVRIHAKSLLHHIRHSQDVDFVEYNQVYHASVVPCAEQIPNNPTLHGLHRVCSDTIQAVNDYNYKFPAGSGQGVTAYIVDTGILNTHEDFTGRVRLGINTVGGSSAVDDNGHGTHVAGTTGGSKYGVAKKCDLVAVKVLNAAGSGSTDGIINGLNWVIKDATTAPRKATTSVVNMSLGGSASTAFDNAVIAVINAGISTVVAAGNNGAVACNYSPARVSTVISVGSLTRGSNTKISWSNYGTCVDVFAFGDQILSAWHTSITSTNTISGTSMASPHVCGIVAIHLGLITTGNSPASVRQWVIDQSVKATIGSKGTGSPDRVATHGYPECKYVALEAEPSPLPLE